MLLQGDAGVTRELEGYEVERFRQMGRHLDLMWNVGKVHPCTLHMSMSMIAASPRPPARSEAAVSDHTAQAACAASLCTRLSMLYLICDVLHEFLLNDSDASFAPLSPQKPQPAPCDCCEGSGSRNCGYCNSTGGLHGTPQHQPPASASCAALLLVLCYTTGDLSAVQLPQVAGRQETAS